MSKKVILIDSNHAAHRSYNSMRNLSFNGKKTSVVFGYMNILFSSVGIYKPNKIEAIWDPPSGGRHPERIKIKADYKKREKRIDFDFEDFQRQCRDCRKMVNSLGIAQLMKDGQEADDLIFKRAMKYAKKGWDVLILSGDKDFNQLVSPQIKIHNPNKGLIHHKNFKKLIGVETPEQFVDYLSMDGDKSDNIPGVRGYGEVTILKFLKKWGSLKEFAILGTKEKDYDKIIEATGVSKALIDLNWFNKYKNKAKVDKTYYIDEDKKPIKNLKRYKKLCLKFGLKKWADEKYLEKLP